MSATGTLLSFAEFVSYLLVGLNSDYDAFVASVTTRIEPLSPEELYGLLLTHENCLSHSTYIPHSTYLSANFTSSVHGCGNDHGNSCRRGHGRNPSPQFSSHSSPPPLRHAKSTCQVYGKVSHVALKCYHRFDQSYRSDPPQLPHRQLNLFYSVS